MTGELGPDAVTAYLAEVREAGRALARTNVPSIGTVPRIRRMIGYAERLADAAEAALAPHKPVPSVRLVPCGEHRRWSGPLCGLAEEGEDFETENLQVRRACPACQVFDEPYCRSCPGDDGRCQDWPCREYAAIAAALLGETSA